MIHILDDQNNDILDVITEKNVTQNKHRRSLEDYLESFEFTALADKEFAEFLTNRNRIVIPSEDEGYIEFIIDEVRKKRGNNGLKVRVLAVASYLELKKASVIEPQTLNEYTPSMSVGFAINGTEWRPGRIESNAFRTFNISTHTNPFSFLKTVANEFELELNFRTETKGGRVVGRYVDLLERVGDWKGREITFGKDLEGIERREDVSNIYTALLCLSPEDEDGNRLETLVEDREALQRWGRPNPITGELKHLIDVYEPQSERSDMTLEELRQYGRTELNKRINAVISYECDIVDLENVPGMENKKIRFGDTIRIKDEKFNPPLYVEARVFEQQRDIFTKANKHVKLGDFTEFTEEEVHDVWRELRKEIREKISRAELIEYTYDKITIDDKDEHVFNEGKSFTEAVGSDAKSHADTVAINARDEAKTHADTVSNEAEGNAKSYADDRSAQALVEAKSYAVAKTVYESKMQEIALSLDDKVDYEYVDGKLVMKADNETVEALESTVNTLSDTTSNLQQLADNHADELENQDGRITDVQTNIDTLEGSLSATISELSDLEGIISQQQVDITANKDAINLKASRSDLDTVSGDVSTISGQLDVLAGEVSAKAEQSSLETLEGDVTKVSNDLSELTVSVDGISGNVSSLSQTVSDQDTEISSLESSYNQIAGQIEQKVDSTTYQADIDGIIQNLDSQSTAISQNADAIDLKASSTRVDAIEGTVEDHNAQFDVMAGQISSKVDSTYVRGVVNQFKRYDSSFSNEQEFWNSQSWQGSYSGEVLTKGNTMTFRKVDGAKSGKVAVSTNSSETLYSRYAEPIDTLRRYRGRIRIRNTSTADSRIYLGIVCLDKDYNFISGGSGTHRWFLDAGSMVTVPAESDWIELQGDINGIGDDRRSFREGTSYIRICALCNHGFNNSELEIDYIEFEDITDIQNVNNRVSSAETLINQKADSVTVQAISTEVDAIEGRISTAESDITTMAGQIDLKASSVDVDGIESRVSSAELSINGLEGQITSKVEENDVRSIFTQQASSFTFEADQINFDGHVFGQDATFTGKLEGAEITQAGENNSIIMNNDGFYVIDNEFGAKRIAIENIFEPTGTNMYDPHPNFIYFEKDSDIEFRIGGGGPGTGYEDMFLGFSGSNPGIMGIRAGSAMNLYSDKFNFEGGSAEFRSGIYLPNASGFTSDDPQEIMLPYNNRISTHGEGLAIYGNRNNDNNPFKVRSHDNIGSYRNDFEIDGASGRIVSEPTVDNTTTNSANIHVFTSTGRFSRSTSARRYKILEEPIKNDVANKIMNLSPKNWYDKRSFEGYAEYLHRIETGKAVSSDLDLPELLRRTPGLVAEDIEEAGLGDFVQYSEPDEKGKRTVEGVMYDRLWTLLIPIVRDLRNEVDGIKRKLEESK